MADSLKKLYRLRAGKLDIQCCVLFLEIKPSCSARSPFSLAASARRFRSPARRLSFCGFTVLILQFSLVEAHARIVIKWGRPSIQRWT